jgi:gliding motility-associated-like protein
MKKLDLIKLILFVVAIIFFPIQRSWSQACTISTSPDVAICEGGSTILSASGAHTYSWNPGALTGSTVSVSPAITTTYMVIGTDTLLACADTAYITVTVNPLPFVNFTFTPSTSVCQGTIVTLFGNGANTYTWTGGVVNGTPFLPAVSTTYTVTGTDLNGCSNVAQVTVTVKPLPNVTASPGPTICAGQSANLTGGGAQVYVWNPGPLVGANISVSPMLTTTYTVTGMNVITGCSNVATTTVTVNPLPIVGYTATPGTTLCSGDPLILSGTGANTYTWTGGVTNGLPFNPASSGSYIVTGTDGNGCTNTTTANITVNPTPVVGVTLSPNDTICSGTSVTLSGTGASSYVWTGGVINATSFAPAFTGSYTVTGTNGFGCTNTTSATIVVNPTPVITSSPNVNICNGDSVTLTASGADVFTWMPGSISGSSITVAPMVATTYTVTGTMLATGCTATATTNVNINALPSVGFTASPSTVICSGTSLTLSGTGASSYIWTGGITNATSFIPASSGSYIVTGTDVNGCTNTTTANITVNAQPIVGSTVTPALTVCAGANLSLSGTGANTYTWTGGVTDGISFPALATTTYTVTGTDLNGCTNTNTATVTVNPLPVVSYSVLPNDTVCNGASVTLNGMGAVSYSWTGGISDGISFVPVSSGSYMVTGTDINGCTNTAISNIVLSPSPSVGIISSPGSSVCIGSPVTLTGTGASSYSWNNGVIDGVAFMPLSTNTYTLIGSNATGCTDTVTITVTVNPLPAVSFTVSPNDTVCANANVSLTGMGPFGFNWTGGVVDGMVFNPTVTNTYTVTVTDINGCSNTGSSTIVVNPLPVATAGSNSPVCFGSMINLSSSGGNSYGWTGPSSFSSAVQNPSIPFSSLLNGGNYIATVTDALGCTNTDTVNVTVVVPPAGLISTAPSANICMGDSVTLSSSVGSSAYLWDTGDTTASIMVNPVVNTTYALTMINPPFCNGTVMDFMVINVFSNPVANISSTSNDTVCSGTNVMLLASGGSSYVWSTTDSTSSIAIIPTTDTTLTVVAITAQGCMDTASYFITALANPVAPTITASAASICNTGNVQLYANPANNITWMPNSSTNDTLIVGSAGVYQLNYTDSNGCNSSSSINIAHNIVVASIVGDTVVCSGSSNPITAMGGSLFTWNTADTTSTINVSPGLPTLFSVTVSDITGCSDSSSIMVYPFNTLSIDPIAMMDSLNMVENTQGYVNLTLNDTNYSSIAIITPPAHGTGNLNITTVEYIPSPGYIGPDSLQYVICSSICSFSCDTSWLMIDVMPAATVVIPQVITPNGDNYNDTWIIANLNLFPENEVHLMNRWGDIVYTAKPYNNDWVGQANAGIKMFGDKLSTGTYFYVVKLSPTSEPIKGFLELIK